MHNACMATKTISLKLNAYERLKAARRYADESFTQVVLRASWPEGTLTGGELLHLLRAEGPHFSEESLERVEQAKASQLPAKDKWQTP